MWMFRWLLSAEYRKRRARVIRQRTVPVRTRRVGKVLRNTFANSTIHSAMNQFPFRKDYTFLPASGKKSNFFTFPPR